MFILLCVIENRKDYYSVITSYSVISKFWPKIEEGTEKSSRIIAIIR